MRYIMQFEDGMYEAHYGYSNDNWTYAQLFDSVEAVKKYAKEAGYAKYKVFQVMIISEVPL